MQILVIGATGTIGRAVADDLSHRHNVVRVGHRSGALQVDINDPASLQRLFSDVGRVDAVVSAAGGAFVGPLADMSEENMRLGIVQKLLGQMRLARLALPSVNDGGSITLSAGLASRMHRPGWSALAAVNAGVEAFGRAAALDMPRSIRINVVSPGIVRETLQKLGLTDRGVGMPVAEVAQAYVRLVEGTESGLVVDAGSA